MWLHFIFLIIINCKVYGNQNKSVDNLSSAERIARVWSERDIEDFILPSSHEFSTSEILSKLGESNIQTIPEKIDRSSPSISKTLKDSHFSSSHSHSKGEKYVSSPSESHHHHGYHQPHQPIQQHHHHHHHEEYSDKGSNKGHGIMSSLKGNSFVEFALIGLSALAFGSFLLNALLDLFSLFSGFFFTSTGTGTGGGGGGGTTTTTTTSTSTGGGGGGGGGGGTSTGTSTSTSTSTGGMVTFTSGRLLSDVGGLTGGRWSDVGARRPKRSVIELNVDNFTSLEAMSQFVLNSIEAIKHRHECLPYVLCMGNKRAKVIGKGFQYFVPFYSLYAVFLSKDVGLRDLIPEQIRAILRGLSEANCRSDFPQC